MIIFANLHDPQSRYLSAINQHEKIFKEKIPNAIIATTQSTSIEVQNKIKELGWQIIDGGADYTIGKQNGLKAALETKENDLFYFDFDKLLHWLNIEQDEILNLLAKGTEFDFCMFGRSKEIFDTYPDSWIQTETIINKLFSEVFGQGVDPCSSNIYLNRKAGEVISSQTTEKEWGATMEWPLIAKRAGLNVGQITPKGMSWEDPDFYKPEIAEAGSYENWLNQRFDSFSEWEKRVNNLYSLMQTIKRIAQ